MNLLKINEYDDYLVINFKDIVYALSSTVYGYGFKKLTHVIFKKVEKDFNVASPEEYSLNLIKEIGLPLNSTAVFLTAVDVVKEYIYKNIEEPVPISIVATLGYSNFTCMREVNEKYLPSTINILIVIDSKLTENAFIDLVGVVNSVKTLAFTDMLLSCDNHRKAFATITDALIISSYQRGNLFRYGGAGTLIGSNVAKMIYEIILKGINDKISLRDRFRYIFGYDLEDLKKLALRIYKESPIPNIKTEDIKSIIDEEIKKLLNDPNIWAFGLAFRELDYKGSLGAIPYLSIEEYNSDTTKIIADEILGIALSTYINGWKGMFSYYWIDRIKEKIEEFEGLPMFIDDLIGSLIGAILSRIYDRFLNSVED